MKISIDLHGVIDKDPIAFNTYMKELNEDGHKVYILTGSTYSDAYDKLTTLKIDFKNITEIISVTDYLLYHNVPYVYDHFGRPSFDEEIWWNTKAELSKNGNTDLHIDDDLRFLIRFKTPYMHYEYGDNNIIVPFLTIE